MHVVLFLLSGVTFIVGFIILSGAQSAIHEIEAGVAFLITAVLLSGASIVDAIHYLRRNIADTVKDTKEHPDALNSQTRKEHGGVVLKE